MQSTHVVSRLCLQELVYSGYLVRQNQSNKGDNKPTP
jgi:hypothetical protein